jgi:hypothetical protein
MENHHFGFITKFLKKNTDDDHNSSIPKKKKKPKTKLNSTQPNPTQSFTASSKGAILQHCCIGWLQNSYECVENNHLLPSPDILLALVLGRFLFVGVGGWVVIFFLFFSSLLFSLNSV